MTTYTTIDPGDLDQGSPVTEPLMTALNDNPHALNEAANGAPINQYIPHPYNSATIGDGNSGRFYNGASLASDQVDSITEGYDYFIWFQGTLPLAATTLKIEVWDSVAAAWVLTFTSGTVTPPNGLYSFSPAGTATANSKTTLGLPYDLITKIRISTTSGTNLNGGKAGLWRQRHLFSEYTM